MDDVLVEEIACIVSILIFLKRKTFYLFIAVHRDLVKKKAIIINKEDV